MKITRDTAERILAPRFIAEGSHHALLGLLLAMYALDPFLHGPAGELFSTLVWIAVLMSAIGAVAKTRRSLIGGALTMAAAVVASEVADRAWGTGMIIQGAMRTALVIFVTVVITRTVFSQRRVTGKTISGSICIFLFMGLLWSTLYVLVEELAPGSFRGLPDVAGLDVEARNQVLLPALYYYSHVTLTTLGYGDVVPVSQLARTLSTLEAVAGQIYLVVAVARLVGLHIADAVQDRSSDEEGA